MKDKHEEFKEVMEIIKLFSQVEQNEWLDKYTVIHEHSFEFLANTIMHWKYSK